MSKHDDGPIPIWKVNPDGTGQLVPGPPPVPTQDIDHDDLADVLHSIAEMASELCTKVYEIPDICDDGEIRIPPRKFDARTRLAFVQCGNALDYALRLVTDIGREKRIRKLRKDLAEEMKAAGMTGDPE